MTSRKSFRSSRSQTLFSGGTTGNTSAVRRLCPGILSEKPLEYHIKLIALEGDYLLPLASRIARNKFSLLRLRINTSPRKTGKVMSNWVENKLTCRPERRENLQR